MKSVLRRSGLTSVALLVFYFAVPIQNPSEDKVPLALRVGISVLALLGLILAIRWQLLRQLAQPDAPLGGLVVAVVAGALLFALLDYAIEVHWPGQFVGLRTRIDALYFALSTLFTVGFGDITAAGQFARVVVSLQMLFNVIVLATAASFLGREIGRRVRSRHDNL